MKTSLLSGLSICAVVLAALEPASAATLLFDFSGPSGTALFKLEARPKPDYVNAFSFLPGSGQFGFNHVHGTFDGLPGVASTINFGEGLDAALNIVAPGLGFTQFSGPVLFTGPLDAPVFAVGSFTLINPFFGNGTLTVSEAASVPEPAGWTIVLAASCMVGAGIGYRRRGRSAG